MSTLFSGHYLRNRSILDIAVLGYIGIVQHKEHSPEVWSIPPVISCIYIYIYIYIYIGFCTGYKKFDLLKKHMPNISCLFLDVVVFFTVILMSIIHLSVICSPVPYKCITVQKIQGYIS